MSVSVASMNSNSLNELAPSLTTSSNAASSSSGIERVKEKPTKTKELGDLDSDDEDKGKKSRRSLFRFKDMLGASQSNINLDIVTKPTEMMVKSVKGTGSLMKTGLDAGISSAGTVVKGTGTLVGAGINTVGAGVNAGITGAGTLVGAGITSVGAGITSVGAGIKKAGDGLGLSSHHSKGATTKDEDMVKQFFDHTSSNTLEGGDNQQKGEKMEEEEGGPVAADDDAKAEGVEREEEEEELKKRRQGRRRRESVRSSQQRRESRKPGRSNSHRTLDTAAAAGVDEPSRRDRRSTRKLRSSINSDTGEADGGKSKTERGPVRRERGTRSPRLLDLDSNNPDAEPSSSSSRPRRHSRSTKRQSSGSKVPTTESPAGGSSTPRRPRSSGDFAAETGPPLQRTSTGTKVKFSRQFSTDSTLSGESFAASSGGDHERSLRRNNSASAAGLALMQRVADAGEGGDDDKSVPRRGIRRNRSASPSRNSITMRRVASAEQVDDDRSNMSNSVRSARSTVSQRLEAELELKRSDSGLKLKLESDRDRGVIKLKLESDRDRGVTRNRSASSAGLAMMQRVANSGASPPELRRHQSATKANDSWTGAPQRLESDIKVSKSHGKLNALLDRGRSITRPRSARSVSSAGLASMQRVANAGSNQCAASIANDSCTGAQRLDSELKASKSHGKLSSLLGRERGITRNRSASSAGLAMMQRVANAGAPPELRRNKSASKANDSSSIGQKNQQEGGIPHINSSSSMGLLMMHAAASVGLDEPELRRNHSGSMANARLSLVGENASAAPKEPELQRNNSGSIAKTKLPLGENDCVAKSKNSNATFSPLRQHRSASMSMSETHNVSAAKKQHRSASMSMNEPYTKRDNNNSLLQATKTPLSLRSRSEREAFLELLGPLAPHFDIKAGRSGADSEELLSTASGHNPSSRSNGSSAADGGQKIQRKSSRPSLSSLRQSSKSERKERGDRRSSKRQSSRRSVRSTTPTSGKAGKDRETRAGKVEIEEEEEVGKKVPEETNDQDEAEPRDEDVKGTKETGGGHLPSVPCTISVEKEPGTKSNDSQAGLTENTTSLSTGAEDPLDDDMTPIPTPEQLRFWKCVCGEVNEKLFKFCGMCRTSQLWTCSDCGFELNKCRFQYCGACAAAKK